VTAADVALILTAVSTAAIVAAAVFAYQSWRVYEQIRDLAATSNEILDHTAAVAAESLSETRRIRHDAVRPLVRLVLVRFGPSESPGRLKVQARLVNEGEGPAFAVRVEQPLGLGGRPFVADLINAGGQVAGNVEVPGDYRPNEPGGETLPPFPVRVLYRNRLEALLETVQEGGAVVRIATEVEEKQDPGS
jgi:hypothetical protein